MDATALTAGGQEDECKKVAQHQANSRIGFYIEDQKRISEKKEEQ